MGEIFIKFTTHFGSNLSAVDHLYYNLIKLKIFKKEVKTMEHQTHFKVLMDLLTISKIILKSLTIRAMFVCGWLVCLYVCEVFSRNTVKRIHLNFGIRSIKRMHTVFLFSIT